MASHTAPIEIDAGRRPPLGMTPARFLRDHWQKRPLLVRGAFPRFRSPLTPNDLAGLACEPLATSRLVVHRARGDRWSVRHGPFAETDFARLPQRDWTLLVQDCDKLIAEVEQLLAPFRFIPDWRVDDVMTSYAVDGGSVGAHVDRYDVFLLQGIGHRRWQISTDPAAPVAFRDGLELKLLRAFEPTHAWTLGPGDLLYLPPGVPHHGVAVGACMTYSIGMRAPSLGELLVDWAEAAGDALADTPRYADPDLSPSRAPAEIAPAAFARVDAMLRAALAADGEARRDWFARFITRYRSAHVAAPRARALPWADFEQRLSRGATLHRSPWSRYAWRRAGRGAIAYLGGDAYRCSLRCARTLERSREYDAPGVRALTIGDRRALLDMLNAGHLVLGS
jgi:50S ribosomal protein L16 3-hydroxylase